MDIKDIHIFKSRRGGQKLCFEGHLYTKRKVSKNIIRWRCSREQAFSCKGEIATDAKITKILESIPHCHDADHDFAAAQVLRAQIKDAVNDANADTNEIMNEVIQGASQNVLSKMGKPEHIRRSLSRKKQGLRLKKENGQEEQEMITLSPILTNVCSEGEVDLQSFMVQEIRPSGGDVQESEENSHYEGEKIIENVEEMLDDVNRTIKRERKNASQDENALNLEVLRLKRDRLKLEIENLQTESTYMKKKLKLDLIRIHEENIKERECLTLKRNRLKMEIDQLQSEGDLVKEKLRMEIGKFKEEKELAIAERDRVRLDITRMENEMNCETDDT